MTTLLVILLASAVYFAIASGALRAVDEEDALEAEFVED